MAQLPSLRRSRSISPWNRLEQMESEMDRLMRSFLSSSQGAQGMGWSPSVDMVDTDGEYTVTAELPGVKPEDVHVEIDEGVLTLKGEKRDEREEKTRNRRIFEREYGSFERSFTLPRSVDPENVEAEFKNGILTVHLPKREESMGRKIEIQAGEPGGSRKKVEAKKKGQEH